MTSIHMIIDTQTHREGHIKTEVKIRVIYPQAQECQWLPETGQDKEWNLPRSL